MLRRCIWQDLVTDCVGVEEEEKGEIQCNSQASVLGYCVLGSAITRMGNIGRRVVWEVGEERDAE